MFRLPFATTFLFWGLLGCSSLGGKTGMHVEDGLVFKSVSEGPLKGDLYLPEGPGPHPAIVVVHGGGWARRSGDMVSLCRDLARAGFAAYNVTYRLAPTHRYPLPVEDVRDAIVWLKSQAREHAIDPERISAWGYSAGAHLILMAGLSGELGLKAIVAGGTPADLTAWPESPLVTDHIGGTFVQKPDLWREASPARHVTGNSPPVFLYHGKWDTLVEPEQMAKMEKALKEKDRPVETYAVPFMGHVAVYFLSQESVTRGIEFIRRATRPAAQASSP